MRAPLDRVDRIREQWHACLAPESVTRFAETIVLTDSGATPDEVEYQLTQRVTQAAILAQRGRRLMLHAAAIADRTSGRAAALVAESGGGKTTAARRLCRRGFAYLTDEAVAIDEQRVALRYCKPLSIVTDPDRPFDKSQHSPAGLGLLLAEDDAPVDAVILLARSTSPAPPRLEDVPLLDALLQVIPQTSALPSLEHPLTRLVELFVACGGVQRLHYRDIEDAAELIRASIARTDPAEAPVLHRPDSRRRLGPEDEPVAHELPSPPARVTRAPFTEAVEHEDEILVLAGTSSLLLRGIGPLVWLAAHRPITLDELVAECVSRFGDPGDAVARVRDATNRLLSHGLLAPEPD